MFLRKLICAIFFLQSANIFCGDITKRIKEFDVEGKEEHDESNFEAIKKAIEISKNYEDLSSARHQICGKIALLPKAPPKISGVLHWELNELHAALNASLEMPQEHYISIPEEMDFLDINIAIEESPTKPKNTLKKPNKDEEDCIFAQESQESKALLHLEKTKKQAKGKRKCTPKDTNPNPLKKKKTTCKVRDCHEEATIAGYCNPCRTKLPSCIGVNGQRCDNIAKHRDNHSKGQKIYCPACKNLAI